MKTSTLIVITVLVLLLLAGAIFMFNKKTDETINDNGTDTSGLIRVTSPLAGATVRSPLVVTGEARGNWYFEADFPVRLFDGNGREIALGIAQAQGDWMTAEFVPFTATLVFDNPTTAQGTLVLEKDNPSGLPENAAEVRFGVRFEPTAEPPQTRGMLLYFYNENRDRDAGGNIQCSAQGLVAVGRTIPLTNTPIQDAVRELLKGPTAAERLQAPNTEFPLSGVALTGASLSSGILTLSFTDPENKTGGGSCRVNILRAQIEATAKQFGGVGQVRFLPETLFQP